MKLRSALLDGSMNATCCVPRGLGLFWRACLLACYPYALRKAAQARPLLFFLLKAKHEINSQEFVFVFVLSRSSTGHCIQLQTKSIIIQTLNDSDEHKIT